MTAGPADRAATSPSAASNVEQVMRAKGLPLAFHSCPPHLQAAYLRYADPKLWSSLEITCHDEKDMKLMRGWLCDLGDGECQRIFARQNDALDAAKMLRAELRSLPAQSTLPSEEYGRTMSFLSAHKPLIAKYESLCLERSSHWEKRIAAIQKLQQKHGPSHKDYARRVKLIGDLNGLAAEVDAYDRRVAAWTALVQQLPAPAALSAAPQTAQHVASVIVDAIGLLETGLELGETPCSKAMAFITSSAFDVAGSSLSRLHFTPADLKTWQVGEMLYRHVIEEYRHGKRVVGISADKAFAKMNGWDRAGYPMLRTAVLREVEYMLKFLPEKSGEVEVSIRHWPRTKDVRAVCEEALRDPRAIVHGMQREDWMDDFVLSQTRDRWVEFALSWHLEKVRVPVIGLVELCTQAGLDMNALADAPLSGIKLAGLRELAEDWCGPTGDRLVQPGEGVLKAKEYKTRLKSVGVTRGRVAFRHLSLTAKRKVPAVRQALQAHLNSIYRARGRDFELAYSYPEELEVAPGTWLPHLLFWDEAHALKNLRMASVHAWVRSGASATAAAAAARTDPAATDAADDDPDDVDVDGGEAAAQDGLRAQLFDEHELNGYGAEEDVTGANQQPASHGSLAYKIAVATNAIIQQEGQKLVHPKTLSPSHDPQDVNTARKLFSLETAAEMARLGHSEAAAFVRVTARAHIAADGRGYAPISRWDVWEEQDEAIEVLHESFRWNPSSPVWVSPKTASIEGYSRVVLECYRVTNDSSRWLDLMVGPEGCRFVCDRHKQSDPCECFFSQCVAKMDKDKATKYQWLKFLGPIMRMSRRRVMDVRDRKTPLNAQQKHVYMRSDFVQGWRCCRCSSPCQIGGHVNPQCACAAEGRHVKADEKRVLRPLAHSEPSTRNKMHKH